MLTFAFSYTGYVRPFDAARNESNGTPVLPPRLYISALQVSRCTRSSTSTRDQLRGAVAYKAPSHYTKSTLTVFCPGTTMVSQVDKRDETNPYFTFAAMSHRRCVRELCFLFLRVLKLRTKTSSTMAEANNRALFKRSATSLRELGTRRAQLHH